MHTVLKKILPIMLLAGAVSGAAQAAHLPERHGQYPHDAVQAAMPASAGAYKTAADMQDGAMARSAKAPAAPRPGEAAYLNEANLIALANAAPAAGAQAAPAPITPIPEPPMYLMVLIGFGLVSLVARRSAPPPAFNSDNHQ